MADMPKLYRVYSLVPRAKQEDYWACIGTATPHGDGLGYSLTLNALPINGESKLVMRAYDPQDHEQDEAARQLAAKKTMGSELL